MRRFLAPRRLHRFVPLLVAAGLVLAFAPAWAQTSSAGEPTRAMVPMPDGVELATDVYLPDGEGPFSALLVRTPYGIENKNLIATYFAARGIAAVVQDARGTGASEGRFVALVNEYADGLATLDWIAGRPWSDGRVVLYGASYGGHAALELATSGHAALVAVAHLAGWADTRSFLYEGGELRVMAHIPWLATYGAGGDAEWSHGDDWGPLLATTPLSRFFAAFEPVEDDIFRPFPYDEVDVPVLHIAGWYDYIYPSTMEAYRELGERGVEQRLVVGPWRHNQIWMETTKVGDEEFGPRAYMGFDAVHAELVAWFERHLSAGPGPEEPPVEVFVMGENRWHEADAWPPADVETTRWYLASDGDAADPDGSGRLVDAPVEGSAIDAFVYDPNDPPPTVGGVLSHFFWNEAGSRDQREVEARPDVLVYTSDPLAEEIVLAGPLRAVLHVSSEAPDFDVSAKLVVVRPDGFAGIVEDGIVRAAHAAGSASIAPGEVRPYTVEIGHTALRIPAGHRLRLELSAGNFPKYARNPQTGEDPLDAESFRPARHVVHHSEEHPSHLVLPIWKELPDLTEAR